MKHILKCQAKPFNQVWTGNKKFEIRFNDRKYRDGDILEMYELFEDGFPTGRTIVAKCGHVMDAHGSFGGLKSGFVIISLTHTSNLKQSRTNCRRMLGMVAENA